MRAQDEKKILLKYPHIQKYNARHSWQSCKEDGPSELGKTLVYASRFYGAVILEGLMRSGCPENERILFLKNLLANT